MKKDNALQKVSKFHSRIIIRIHTSDFIPSYVVNDVTDS